MNKLTLLGRLVRDPEVRYTNNGMAVTKFTIAVDRPYHKDRGKEADFIPCTAFNKTAETIGNYFGKGNRILVDGSMRVESYDGKDGKKRYQTYCLVNNFEFIDARGQNDGAGATSADNAAGGFESMGSSQNFTEEIPF